MRRFVVCLTIIALVIGIAGCSPGDLNEPFYAPAVLPNANNTGNVGSSVLQWGNGYFQALTINGVPLIGGSSITWLGAWVGMTPYVLNDAVSYNGSSYICTLAITSNTSPNLDGAHWGLLSAAGTNGTNGAPGSVWYSGAGAPGVGLGIDGDYYLNSSNGDVYLKATGVWAIVDNLTGPTGATGAPGSVWYSGAGAPAGGLGINGDFYLNTSNNDVYSKAAGVWTLTSNFNGVGTSIWYDGAGAPAGGLGVNGDYYLNNSNSDVYTKAAGVWGVILNIKGATGATGPVGMVWHGTYDPAHAYVPGDAVAYLGSSYMCTSNTTGNYPPNVTYWDVLALKAFGTLMEFDHGDDLPGNSGLLGNPTYTAVVT